VRKKALNKLTVNEKGQALIIVVVLMLLGALIIAPLLSHVSSGLKTGREVFEEKMYGQYAADSGVEDALYKIRVDDQSLPPEWEGVWDADSYDTSHTYYLSSQVNDNDVKVTIQPYWILTGLESSHEGMMPHAEMVVVGNVSGTDPVTGNGVYQISISYDMSKGELFIMRIGAWLPAGFEYVPGSSNLEQTATPQPDYYCVPVTDDFRGGKTIKWNYSSPYVKFQDFPGGSTGQVAITFQYTPSGSPASAFTWVREKRGDVYLSWDVGVKLYQINSEATDIDSGKLVTVEAYTAKNETPGMGSAISGDYVATGNSLMMPDPNNNPSDPNQDWRSRLLKESSAIIPSGSISADATIELAYLYWSGFIDHYYWYRPKKTNEWLWSADPDNWSVPQDNATGLVYPDSPTPQELTDLVETAAKVNIVSFGASGGVMQDITTHTWEVWPKTNDSPACWYYTCFYDATDIVKPLIDSGVTTFTLGHASTVVAPPSSNLRPGFDGDSHGQKRNITYKFDLLDPSGSYTVGYTGYPLGTPAHKLPYPPGEWNYGQRFHASYAGWSLIVIYSSPETEGHQLYLYDIRDPKFIFKESYPEGASESNPDFDGDGNPGGRISGFLVPEPVLGEVNAAHMTCFVGEGDKGKTGDSFKVTGPSGSWAYLLDGLTGTVWDDVWNSQSVGITAPGIDIDTFYVTWASGILDPGDTWAQVDIPTVGDGFTLSYIILSFRSDIKTSGAMSYMYVGGG
jgi:hypothetical protein